MKDIFIGMFYELSVLVMIAFVITRISFFKNLIVEHKTNLRHKIILAVIFGSFGILGTYMGIPIEGAIANSRSVGVIISGLLGGPLVGILSGLIASTHRFAIDIGGFSTLACSISTITESIIAGLLSVKYRRARNKFLFTFFVGLICESIQMIIILIIAKPYMAALHLVSIIWIPMSIMNSFGIAIFIIIIDSIYAEKEKIFIDQTLVITEITGKLMKYFSNGYNELSTYSAAKTIKKLTGAAAVSFTNKNKILVHVGIGSDHHKSGETVHTKITREAILDNETKIAETKKDIECDNSMCPLKSAVISPLHKGNEVVGVFKMYKDESYAITGSDIKLAEGLSKIISTLIEMHDIKYKEKLLEKAKFKALQAQINPHFLFNTLNTIMSLCRTEPLKARDVLFNLSIYLRRNMEIENDLVPIEKELEHVKSFVNIQKARFGDKININYKIDDNCSILIPPLTIQPLVENSIKHGLLKKEDGGTVDVIIKHFKRGYIIIVKDDGYGMDETCIKNAFINNNCKEKIGLNNVNKRLVSYYGDESKLNIKSKLGHGTIIEFYIPNKENQIVEGIIS